MRWEFSSFFTESTGISARTWRSTSHKTFLEPNVIGNISVMETKQVAWLWNINGGSEFDVARCLVRGIINELISNSRGIYS